MTTVPEEAVKAAVAAYKEEAKKDVNYFHVMMRAAITAALPHLPQGVGVKDWQITPAMKSAAADYLNSLGICEGSYDIAHDLLRKSFQAEQAINGNSQPSAECELALEEILREIDEIERKAFAWSGSAFLNNELEGAEDADCKTELYSEFCGIGNTMHWLRTKICALSSPDHADDLKTQLEKANRKISDLNEMVLRYGVRAETAEAELKRIRPEVEAK